MKDFSLVSSAEIVSKLRCAAITAKTASELSQTTYDMAAYDNLIDAYCREVETLLAAVMELEVRDVLGDLQRTLEVEIAGMP